MFRYVLDRVDALANRIERVLVAEVAGRLAPVLPKAGGGFAAELKRLADASSEFAEGAIDADCHVAKAIRKLTPKDISAIRDFADEGFMHINPLLGGGSRYPRYGPDFVPRPEQNVRGDIRKLARALRKLPNFNGWVVRSFAVDNFAHLRV